MSGTTPGKDHLLDSVTRLATLDQAWEKVRANGGCAGGDGMTIAAFQGAAGRRIAKLSAELRAGSYLPGALRTVEIPKRKGGTRRLTIPSVRDRIVHTALAQVLTPVLEPMFEDASFAYRPGRSVRQAVQAIGRWRDAGYWHVIEADIVTYFDAIPHDALLTRLETALGDRDGAAEIVDLVARWLEHQGLQTGRPGHGVAQGSPLSPLLANLYLDAFDEQIEGKGVRLVRFADDFVVLCKRRKTAEAALEEVTDLLAEHGLEMHSEGTRIVDFDRGFEFLGHLFVRSLTMQQVSDPEEDAVSLLRSVAAEDNRAAAEAAELAEAVRKEAAAGYDRGDRVLYLTEPGRRLALRNLSFAVEGGTGRELAAVAHGRVDRIEVGPGTHVDPAVYDHALATDTDLVFVDGFGAQRGWLARPEPARAVLHLAQAEGVLSDGFRLAVARALVDARLRNQRTQLFRLNRKPQDPEVVAALTRMGRHLRKLPQAESVETLRGLEGATAAEYWPALARLCCHAADDFRRSRPGTDPLNASVNYLTAVLGRDLRSAVLAAGLHPGFGHLHAAQDGADALVFDLMEPFRAPLTEGLAVFLFNSGRLKPEMFTTTEAGGIRIRQPARRALIAGYESAVARRVNVTGRKMRLAWRPLMRRQAVDLGKAARAADPDLFLPYLMEA